MWRGQRNRFLIEDARTTGQWIHAVGGTVQLALMLIFLSAGYPFWRVATAMAVYATFALIQKIWIPRARDTMSFDRVFIGTNLSAQTMVTVMVGLTGGLHSPSVPGLLLPSVISLLFFGPHAVARWIAFASGLLIIAMGLLPQSVVGPLLPSGHYALALIIGLGWNLFLLHMMVIKMTRAASKAGHSMACLREERLSDAEAQLRRLQSVGAKVAHELKNPLASIKGLCQLVARTPESDRTQERLAVVASEISRMETILNEYLSFSRPLEDLRPESLDVSAIARDVLDVLAGRADQAGVTMTLDGGAPAVHGDGRRLKEALINLVANAIEATPGGGTVALRLRTSGGAGPGSPRDFGTAVVLEVRDSGRGIAPEDLERIGTSFFTTRPNGTGLGVVLAQGVINQHGGTLTYASTLGHGTTATITLPIKPQPLPEPTPRAAMVEARA
ncbi:MAG TPA: ATP-binding protein [Kofleriaceae bacterium]|nr:ATP-binding protein [Kofleriaceae bacterium]